MTVFLATQLTNEELAARKLELALEYGITPEQVTILPYVLGAEEEKFLKVGARWDNTKEVRSGTYDEPEGGGVDDTFSAK